MTRVIILNSGTGSRMGELTADRPKGLVEIGGGQTILGRQLNILAKYGLEDILITTGPFEEQIKKYAAGSPGRLRVRTVNNPAYEKTNYIYSLLLAGEKIGSRISGGIVVLHGDLVFDPAVLEKLLASGHRDAVLINPHSKLPEKDFKAELEQGLVKKIGVDLFGNNCAFLIPFYRLSGEVFSAWLQEMERFRERGELTVYAENALNNLLPSLKLHPVELKEEFCMEIDDREDLEKVRNYLSGGGEG